MVRRYYDRYRKSYGRRGVGFLPKVILVVCALGALFLYRDTILQYLADNPDTAKHVPDFVTNVLERDLEDWKQEDLQARYAQLTAEVQTWQTKLTTAAQEGQDKFNEVQTNLSEARTALNETKAALDKLTAAGENLKSAVTPASE